MLTCASSTPAGLVITHIFEFVSIIQSARCHRLTECKRSDREATEPREPIPWPSVPSVVLFPTGIGPLKAQKSTEIVLDEGRDSFGLDPFPPNKHRLGSPS